MGVQTEISKQISSLNSFHGVKKGDRKKAQDTDPERRVEKQA